MISFRVRGRTVSVLHRQPEAAGANAKLDVTLDRRRPLEAAHIVRLGAEAGQQRWQVHLPSELYDGQSHHIAMEVKTDGRLAATVGFQFTGAPQLLGLAGRAPVADPAAMPAITE